MAPSLGSTLAYSVGGAVLTTAVVFSIVAAKKGIRQKNPASPGKPRVDPVAFSVTPLLSGFVTTLGGRF